MAKANIALIGFMGAGKTTLGGLLSRSLDMGFFDMDSEIEKCVGMPVAQIFSEFGEGHFRALEHEMCKKIAHMDGFFDGFENGIVVATGGGVLLDTRNLVFLKESCVVVYLKASLGTLSERLAGDETRPLLADIRTGAHCTPLRAAEQVIERLLREREAVYEAAADFVVEVDGKNPSVILNEVKNLLLNNGILR